MRKKFPIAGGGGARMVVPMRVFLLLACSLLAAVGPARAAAPSDPAAWEQVSVAPMKTSIYVGSVTLTTAPFARHEATFASTYTARVFPWIFWSETGAISIALSDADVARLARGETVEFKGDARNQKNKPRQVTGRAQPLDARSGKIKVRISADGFELVFNGSYQLGPGK